MAVNRKSKVDIQSRNKGRAVSFIFHLLILVALFLPIFAMKPPERPSREALVFQFDYPYNSYIKPEKFETEINTIKDTDLGSKMSGSESGGSPESEPPPQVRAQQSAPSKLASTSLPSIQPTTTTSTSSALRTDIGEIPLPTPKIVTRQSWQQVSESGVFETDGVEEMKMIDWSAGAFGTTAGAGKGDGGDADGVSTDGFGTGTGGRGGKGTGPGDGVGAGSGPGGGTGVGGAGSKTGVGQDGSGLSWGVGLDGELSRPLVQRANVGSLAVKEGRVTIYICVNRAGKVVSTKYNVAKSTLRDPSFATKAELVARDYVFAEDQSAPEMQCGNLSFIFKIQ